MALLLFASSECRTPRKETGSVFDAAGCCSTSAAVRYELSDFDTLIWPLSIL
jgi:hypothetical protein